MFIKTFNNASLSVDVGRIILRNTVTKIDVGDNNSKQYCMSWRQEHGSTCELCHVHVYSLMTS